MPHTNRLIHATSPYLLQHAHNPVDWHEWGEDALHRAQKEDKPILVSIGYAACHWCHVMEHESFEDEQVAAWMNASFICIKVDREERPDIDQVYMDAVQAMGIHGGWPLNVFLTPGQEPFYGGTYFPRQAWTGLLQQIAQAWKQRRTEVEESSHQLTEHLRRSDLDRFLRSVEGDAFRREPLDAMFRTLRAAYDTQFGGTDQAPKFVMPSLWQFLLRYHALSKEKEALQMVAHTLSSICRAGLYDQVAGGFARYAVDAKWFAPHFEKMLYDNAQLLSLFSELHRSQPLQLCREVVAQTADWLALEMTHPDGGFYSALDADSEGEEGKYYTWTWDELEKTLGPDRDLLTTLGATPGGNWEHGRNILMRPALDETQWMVVRKKLAAAQKERVRPGLDDKILAGWNAMTVQGLVDAYVSFGEQRYLTMATQAMSFLETHLMEGDRIFRSYRNKRSPTEGFLEDYAFVSQAYLALYQATFEEQYLQQAIRWTEQSLTLFYDTSDGFFFYAASTAERLIARKKEIFDNVIPGANSVMARLLLRLGTLMDRHEWKDIAIRMASSLAHLTETEPRYMSNWAILFSEIHTGLSEVVVLGPRFEELRKELMSHPLPFAVWAGGGKPSSIPLLMDRWPANEETTVYVCRNNTCQLPVTTAAAALAQLK